MLLYSMVLRAAEEKERDRSDSRGGLGKSGWFWLGKNIKQVLGTGYRVAEKKPRIKGGGGRRICGTSKLHSIQDRRILLVLSFQRI